MKLVEGKVGIITGAGQGLGRASALRLAREGAKVAVAELNKEDGQKVVKQIKDEGGEAIFIHTDVTKEDAIKNMIKVTVDTYGRLDFLDNGAGAADTPTPTVEITEDWWNKVINLNLKAPFLGMKHAIPEMIKGGGGSIVNFSSAGGMVGFVEIAPYCAAKAGVINMTRSVALEYATKNIRVNCISPGMMDTHMTDVWTKGGDEKLKAEVGAAANPIGRLGRPEEVANMVLFLVSDESSFCTGANFPVDGGMTCD